MTSKCTGSFYDCLGGKHRSGHMDVTYALPGEGPRTWGLVTGTAALRGEKSIADLRRLVKKHSGLSFSLDFKGVAVPFDPVHCQGRKYRDSFDPVKAKGILGDKYPDWIGTTLRSLPLFPKESSKYSKKVSAEFLKESTVVGVVDHIRFYPAILTLGPKALMDNHAYGNLGVLDSVVTEMAQRVDGTSKESLDQFMEYYTYASAAGHGRANAQAVLALAMKLKFVHLVDPALASAAVEKNRRDVLKLMGVTLEDIKKRRLHAAHGNLEKYTYAAVAAGEANMSLDDLDAIVKDMLIPDDRAAGTNQWDRDDRIRRQASDRFRTLSGRGKVMVLDARDNIVKGQESVKPCDDYEKLVNLQTLHEDKIISVEDMKYDDLYMVHETAFTVERDEDGNLVLYPHGDKTGSNRKTLHFGVNHKVLGHMERPGHKSKFAVVVNMKKLVDLNPGCVDAIHEVDTILTPPTGRGLKLPPDCEIVEYKRSEVTAESRNDAVQRALHKAGSRFSFCGKGSTNSVAVAGVSERLSAIAVEQGVLYAHATKHPMYHHEMRSPGGQHRDVMPVVIASTADKGHKGSSQVRVSADMVARLSPNGRARLFTGDAWIRSDNPPLPIYEPADTTEELDNMWRQFAELGANTGRPELCSQLLASEPLSTNPETLTRAAKQVLDMDVYTVPPDADALSTPSLFKETLLHIRGRRVSLEGINAQASCEQRAAEVRDTLIERHGLVRCATEIRMRQEYSGHSERTQILKHLHAHPDDPQTVEGVIRMAKTSRAGLPTYRESVTDNGISRIPLAVFTLVGVTASGEVISYRSRDKEAAAGPESFEPFNPDVDANLTRHPSVADALRGTGTSSKGHDMLVDLTSSILNKHDMGQEHVEEFDDMVLGGGDNPSDRETRGALLARMSEYMPRRRAID